MCVSWQEHGAATEVVQEIEEQGLYQPPVFAIDDDDAAALLADAERVQQSLEGEHLQMEVRPAHTMSGGWPQHQLACNTHSSYIRMHNISLQCMLTASLGKGMTHAGCEVYLPSLETYACAVGFW